MDPGQTTRKQATAICPFYALSWKDITLQVFVRSGLDWLCPQPGIYPKAIPGKFSCDFSFRIPIWASFPWIFSPPCLSTYWFWVVRDFFKPFNFPLCGHIFRKTWLYLFNHENRLLADAFSERLLYHWDQVLSLLLFFLQVPILAQSLVISLF